MVGDYPHKTLREYYSNLTKQFVEENGQIKDDDSIKLLNAFLENAEREEGKFTYGDLNTINDISSQLMVQITNDSQSLQFDSIGGAVKFISVRV